MPTIEERSHWIDRYFARIDEIIAVGSGVAIDFGWEVLDRGLLVPVGHVGWREFEAYFPDGVTHMLLVASVVMQTDRRAYLRMTSEGHITAIQSVTPNAWASGGRSLRRGRRG